MNKTSAVLIAYLAVSTGKVSPKDVVAYASKKAGCDMTLEEASDALSALWVEHMCDKCGDFYHNRRFDYLLNGLS